MGQEEEEEEGQVEAIYHNELTSVRMYANIKPVE
jgi:hypothetical protein